MIKNAPHGYVAQQFSMAAGYVANVQPGDVVYLCGSMTVGTYGTAGAVGGAIGRVATISDDLTSWVVVELFGAMILEQIAGAGGVTFGQSLKSSAANTVVAASPGTTATDIPLTWGTALNTAAAGATVYVLPTPGV